MKQTLFIINYVNWVGSDTEAYLSSSESSVREPVYNGCPWTAVRNKYLNFLELIPTQIFSPLVFHRHLSNSVGEERFQLFHSIFKPIFELCLSPHCTLRSCTIAFPFLCYSNLHHKCKNKQKDTTTKNTTFCISKYLSHGFRRKILIVLVLVIFFCISRLHLKNVFTVGPHN